MSYISPATKKYFDTLQDLSKWKKRNRFYYSYIDFLVSFLLPKDKSVYKIFEPTAPLPPSEGKLGYAVISDVLGYIYDIEGYLRDLSKALVPDGRIIVTQYSAFWEPILRLASFLRLRRPNIEQNWLSLFDLKNFARLAGLEVVRSGTKMLMPVYVPLLSAFCNSVVANIFPFSRLGLVHYLVLRKDSVKIADNSSLSIIVPARNEAGTIQKIANELPTLGSFTEIIFVEGHSEDQTLSTIEEVVKNYKGDKRLSFAVQTGKGKGDAVRKGFDMAVGDVLSIYDADMTVPPDEIRKFYRALVENRGEFVNGSRLVYPLEKESMRVLNFFGNKFFSFAFSSILGQPLKDTLCGTKVLWRKDYEEIKRNRSFFGDFDPFGDFDLLFGAAKLNLKIIDMPVHYKERIYGTTNISRWKHGWLLLKMTIFAAKKLKFF